MLSVVDCAMTAKPLLGTVYYAAKLFGIMPIHLCAAPDDKNTVAELTPCSTIYVIFAAILFTILFVFSLLQFIVPEATSDPNQETINFVLNLDSYSAIIRNISIYTFVIINRDTFMQTVNRANRIVNELRIGLNCTSFIDQRCTHMVFVQICMSTMQLSLSIWLAYSYCISNSNYTQLYLIQTIIMMCYSLCFQAVVSAVHFTVFLMIVQFIRHINQGLVVCLKRIEDISHRKTRRSNMRMQMFCDVSDQIDELAALYKCITNCNEQFCKVFSISILVSIINSFVFALASVLMSVLFSSKTQIKPLVFCSYSMSTLNFERYFEITLWCIQSIFSIF